MMTVGRGLAIAGMWVGVGIISFGSPGVAAIALIAVFVMTIGMVDQTNG